MAFNPKEHLIQLGGRDYLETKWRLVWFREDHPKGSITTELVSIEPPIVKATVADGDGHILATGLASAVLPPSGNAVWKTRIIEKAETAAIGRALAVAGYGTQFSDEDEGDYLADSPVEQKRAQPARTAPAKTNVVNMPQSQDKPTDKPAATRAALSPDKLVNMLKTKAANVDVEMTKLPDGTIKPIDVNDAKALAREMETVMLTKTRQWILMQAFNTDTCKELRPNEAGAIHAWLIADKAAARQDAEGVRALIERTATPANTAAEGS